MRKIVALSSCLSLLLALSSCGLVSSGTASSFSATSTEAASVSATAISAPPAPESVLLPTAENVDGSLLGAWQVYQVSYSGTTLGADELEALGVQEPDYAEMASLHLTVLEDGTGAISYIDDADNRQHDATFTWVKRAQYTYTATFSEDEDHSFGAFETTHEEAESESDSPGSTPTMEFLYDPEDDSLVVESSGVTFTMQKVS